MFATEDLTKSTLLCGPLEFTKSLIFEAAIHWAEKGHRVIYITPARIESLPATYHDRRALSSSAFKLMRFMYLPTYEILTEQLVALHTFAVLPSVVLVDDLDAYVDYSASNDQPDVDIARLCTIIQDSCNACARILKDPVHLCVSTSPRSTLESLYPMYFDAIWHLRFHHKKASTSTDDCSSSSSDGHDIFLSRSEEDCCSRVYNYRSLADRTLVLKQITEKIVSS